MTQDAASLMRARIKADLRDAMKSRRTVTVATLRSLLAAIDNAEAVDGTAVVNPVIGRSNDVPRRELSEAEVRQLVQREADEYAGAVATYERLGLAEELEKVRLKLEVTRQYLK
jgi:uncharacterized protein YqeY